MPTILLRTSLRGIGGVLIGLYALGPASALAASDDALARSWTFAGYGSAGLVHSSETAADFSANVINPGRAGYSRRYSYDVDSRIAGQVNFIVDPQWSAVLQVISERNLNHDFSPAIEWANVKYRYSPDLSVRVGRIALPVFLIGDYRKASYALPWVRPPIEVYSALPVSNSDGVDVSYRWGVGAANNITQVSFGRTKLRVSESAHARARQLIGLSNTTTLGALTVRGSIMSTTLTVDIAKPLFNAFRQFGPAGGALADKYDVESKRTSVAALGFNYDPGSWFLMGEIGRMNARSFLGDKTVSYLSSGYRWGTLTPYVSYSNAKANQATSDSGLSLAGLPPQVAPVATVLNAQLNGLLRTIAVQSTATAGVRWDFMRDRSLKLQYDRLSPRAGTSGTLSNVQPEFQSGHPVHAVSAMLDFVF